jgi:hypothetical protein
MASAPTRASKTYCTASAFHRRLANARTVCFTAATPVQESCSWLGKKCLGFPQSCATVAGSAPIEVELLINK